LEHQRCEMDKVKIRIKSARLLTAFTRLDPFAPWHLVCLFVRTTTSFSATDSAFAKFFALQRVWTCKLNWSGEFASDSSSEDSDESGSASGEKETKPECRHGAACRLVSLLPRHALEYSHACTTSPVRSGSLSLPPSIAWWSVTNATTRRGLPNFRTRRRLKSAGARR
jgi:hypothetical protein